MLYQAHIAHGNLSATNVMVETGGRFVLIDYDGVYIPDFVNLRQIDVGHNDYQHPEMARRSFNEYMDAFPALVIYTALLALAVRPELWSKYVRKSPEGKLYDTNLLFVSQDFVTRSQSPLMQELQSIGDTQLSLAVQELQKACRLPIHQVRFPFHIIEPHYFQHISVTAEPAAKNNPDIQIRGSELSLPISAPSTTPTRLTEQSFAPLKMTIQSSRTIKIFYCYAHEDKALRDELEKHLGALKRLGQITGWYDREIQAGTAWEREIETKLTSSSVILLLISADFIYSDYCYSVEMQKALELHQAGRACVIPVILRPVDWQGTPIAQLQALPSEGKPVNSSHWHSRDDAFYDVARGIRKRIETILSI